jgi:hypothetical protein
MKERYGKGLKMCKARVRAKILLEFILDFSAATLRAKSSLAEYLQAVNI